MDLDKLKSALSHSLLDNSLESWVLAVLAALLVYILLGAMKGVFQRRRAQAISADAPPRPFRRALLAAGAHTSKLFIFIVAIAAGAYLLRLPHQATGIIHTAAIIALFLQAALWLSHAVGIAAEHYARTGNGEDDSVSSALGLIQLFARLGIWALASLLILDNLGFNITTLVAGLGIGGIAVALAAQNILADLFASLSIVLDKPFVKGDFIVFGDYMGTVERIGLKTTRLRSLSGEQIVCANTDLLNSRIRNYKRMWERRVIFGFGVVYQTTPDQLEAIPGMVRAAIEAREQTRFDRAHFKTYGASSLDFEVVYWVKSPDFNTYMDIQQAINLTLFRRFAEAGIEFAYPTQTLYVTRSGEDEPPA